MRLLVNKIACFVVIASAAISSSVVAQQSISDKIEYQGSSRYVNVAGLVARERNSLTNLQIELVNPDNRPRKVFWRVKWLDESGFQVWDDEPWKPVLLQGSAKINLISHAPTIKAKDFRIQFNAEDNFWVTDSQNEKIQ